MSTIGEKMRKDQKVRLFKVGVCLGRVEGERILENLRSGPWIVKVASFSVHHYRQFPNKDDVLSKFRCMLSY